MPEPDLHHWLDEHAHPLETVRPGQGTADLDRWLASLADTRVLGIGEAVIGTRELALLAHRLVETLVDTGRVRCVVVGAPEAAAVAIDDAAAAGEDLAVPLDGVGDWRWRTGDVRNAMAWLAEHNAERDAAHRVRLVGVDPVLPAAAAKAIGLFLRKADPELLEQVGVGIHRLVTHRPDHAALPASVRDDVERVRTRLDGAGATQVLRRHATALVRTAEQATAPVEERQGVRERLMADGIAAAVEEAGDPAGEGPTVLWWDHARRTRARLDDGVPSVGGRLRERYGDGYYALGLVAGTGEFRARHHRRLFGLTRDPARHRFGTAPASSVEGVLGARTRLVDLRASAENDEQPDWVMAASWMRVVEDPTPVRWKQSFEPTRPGEYDALALVAQVRQAAVR